MSTHFRFGKICRKNVICSRSVEHDRDNGCWYVLTYFYVPVYNKHNILLNVYKRETAFLNVSRTFPE